MILEMPNVSDEDIVYINSLPLLTSTLLSLVIYPSSLFSLSFLPVIVLIRGSVSDSPTVQWILTVGTIARLTPFGLGYPKCVL